LRYRLFSALELPPALQEHLAEVQAGFEAGVPRGSVRWVRPAGIHVTLKFYGSVKSERVPQIEAGLERAAQQAQPIQLTVQGLGVFPRPARPQVIWVGLRGDLEPLERLAAAVEAEAAALGFRPEKRPFMPHLTLGRVRAGLRPEELRQLLSFLEQADVQPLGIFQPETLNLMVSELRPTGSVYERLFAVTLALKENTSGSY
jgi:2'-5' RNA ligase